jgi:aryl-alcohol dehydrogenase-like predicted oxidoreductase
MDLIVGSAQLTGSYGLFGQSVENSGDVAENFLRWAVQLGFTAVDTAPVYPGAELAIARASVGLSVHTKFDPALDPGESIRGSLTRLQRDFVEVSYFHDPEAALKDGGVLVDQAADLIGKEVGTLGSSVYEVDSLRASLQHPAIGVIQIPVNPLNRSCVEFVAQFGSQGKKIFGRSLLNQGLLACSFEQIPSRMSHLWSAIDRYQRVCFEIGRSPLEAAILWSRDHPVLNGIIVGAASMHQLHQIAGALQQRGLSEVERRLIDEISQPSAVVMDPRCWK